MKLKLICDDLELSGADGLEQSQYDQAYEIANLSGIRISGDKELSIVALHGDDVVGAVWSSFEPDHDYEEEVFRYDFDVAVRPDIRSTGLVSKKIGPRLIKAALEEYNSLSSEFQRSYIRVWVVNPKLAKYLENNFGFESDGEWSQSNPFMEYHG